MLDSGTYSRSTLFQQLYRYPVMASTWCGMGIAISFRLCTYAILSTWIHAKAVMKSQVSATAILELMRRPS